MSREKKFMEIISQYCQKSPQEMSNSARFREDLGFSSLDFMSLLGELEDEFDLELQPDQALTIHTVGDALVMLNNLCCS